MTALISSGGTGWQRGSFVNTLPMNPWGSIYLFTLRGEINLQYSISKMDLLTWELRGAWLAEPPAPTLCHHQHKVLHLPTLAYN